MDGNLNIYDGSKKTIAKYDGEDDNIHVRTEYAETGAPDIRECLALFLLKREYGMDVN